MSKGTQSIFPNSRTYLKNCATHINSEQVGKNKKNWN